LIVNTKTKEKIWDERIIWETDGDVTVMGCWLSVI